MGAAGHNVEELDRLEGSGGDAFKAMRGGKLMVMLSTTEPGDAEIATAVGTGLATVNPLSHEVLARLIDGYPYYRVGQIEAISEVSILE